MTLRLDAITATLAGFSRLSAELTGYVAAVASSLRIRLRACRSSVMLLGQSVKP